jgi:hypothetical protein
MGCGKKEFWYFGFELTFAVGDSIQLLVGRNIPDTIIPPGKKRARKGKGGNEVRGFFIRFISFLNCFLVVISIQMAGGKG